MTTKVKKMELEKRGKNVKATLDKDGVEYIFYARSVDVVDEKKLKSLLKFWKEKAIPDKEAEAGLTEEELNTKLKRMEGKDIE